MTISNNILHLTYKCQILRAWLLTMKTGMICNRYKPRRFFITEKLHSRIGNDASTVSAVALEKPTESFAPPNGLQALDSATVLRVQWILHLHTITVKSANLSLRWGHWNLFITNKRKFRHTEPLNGSKLTQWSSSSKNLIQELTQTSVYNLLQSRRILHTF